MGLLARWRNRHRHEFHEEGQRYFIPPRGFKGGAISQHEYDCLTLGCTVIHMRCSCGRTEVRRRPGRWLDD